MNGTEQRFTAACIHLDLTLPSGYEFKSEICSVYDHMVQIMGDDSEAIKAWMHTAKKSLNNRAPDEYLKTPDGLRLILKLLRRELEMDSVIG